MQDDQASSNAADAGTDPVGTLCHEAAGLGADDEFVFVHNKSEGPEENTESLRCISNASVNMLLSTTMVTLITVGYETLEQAGEANVGETNVGETKEERDAHAFFVGMKSLHRLAERWSESLRESTDTTPRQSTHTKETVVDEAGSNEGSPNVH